MAESEESSAQPGEVELPIDSVKAQAAALEAQLHAGGSSSSTAKSASNSENFEASSPDGLRTQVGKGKGKGKGKAPLSKAAPPGPPPPKAKAKTKADSRSPGAPEAKVPTWKAIALLTRQQDDGGFSAEEIGRALTEMARSTQLQGVDFRSELTNAGPNTPTLFVLSLLDHFDKRQSSSWSHDPANETDEEVDERIEEICISMLTSQNLQLEHGFLSKLRSYVSKQIGEVSTEERSKVEELRDRWVAFMTKGSVKEVDEESKKKKEEEQKAKEEACRKAEQEKVDFWKRQKSRSLENIDWKAMAKFMYCDGGSGGAFLAQIGPQEEAVVIKPLGIKAVEEVVAVEVAKLLSIKVADQRVLGMGATEFYEMAGALSKSSTAMDDASATQAMVHSYQVDDHYQGKIQFAGIVEFVPGHVLQGMPGHEALVGPRRLSIFHQVGRLIALDVVLNNLDRLPAIWTNEGNLGNVMINLSGEVIGIDQQVIGIASDDARQTYLATVRQYVSQSMRGSIDDSKVTERLNTAVLQNCGVEMQGSDFQELLSGSRDVFQSIASMDEDMLKESFKGISERMVATFADPVTPHVGLGRLDDSLDFILQCLAAVTSEVKAQSR
eukprot:CAMPEP_0206562168 /NCGR_PEP_ID=MMETSP0325_2-20121206/22069_1 /ASSEMBLY_ACC=CAM_ASM_000347 /TAXON_ID=2866 /ORGANISM="Crypthecodinium cohnii, Strain Seligo" /LENGTH=609 /DNA_ID=CAMNT_0054064289 /DNA_START=46 /DNA_END=1875 /DNA_ORIENTATION=-